ncbi:unnamed protein product [marine sediment metagenome]|uniref:Uncharacterized protein n=1 Tax=marine sediment metagenome TaxID=412755 RepID=X0SK35_9ZZZZ
MNRGTTEDTCNVAAEAFKKYSKGLRKLVFKFRTRLINRATW